MKKQQLYIDPIERSLYAHLTDNQDPELLALQLLGETQEDVNETEEIDIKKIYHAVGFKQTLFLIKDLTGYNQLYLFACDCIESIEPIHQQLFKENHQLFELVTAKLRLYYSDIISGEELYEQCHEFYENGSLFLNEDNRTIFNLIFKCIGVIRSDRLPAYKAYYVAFAAAHIYAQSLQCNSHSEYFEALEAQHKKQEEFFLKLLAAE